MKYTIPGKGSVNLVGADFLASGGEAKLFKKGGLIYKIYHNASDMIPDGKIHELQTIQRSNVLIPKDILYDGSTRVGFTMDYVKDTSPLCKLFANNYIDQHDISNDTIVELVKVMQETIEGIHAASCIQVDGNELNYLVDSSHSKCYFIDVNSYQTKSFPATVIMPSIRDWTSKVFNELTDWYSFAIIACQLFVGIHPYKGKHPDFKKFDIESRAKAHVSIFNGKVTLPRSVRDFSRIPSNYMDWFRKVFEQGQRIVPPSTVGDVNAKVTYVVIVSTDNFKMEKISQFDDSILYHSNLNNIPVTRTKRSVYIGSTRFDTDPEEYLVHTPKMLTPVLVSIKDNRLLIRSLSGRVSVKLGSEIRATELMVVDNTVYLRNDGNFLEMYFMENATSATLVVKNIWTIHENSSKFFKNVIVQDILGSKYLSIPLPNKNSTFQNIRCAELDDYKVLDGKYECGICVLSLFHVKDNVYKLAIITNTNDIRFINTDDYASVNFVVLDNDVTLLMYDDTLEIFHTGNVSKVKLIKDSHLSSNMTLCKRGSSAQFFTDDKLYSISMK